MAYTRATNQATTTDRPVGYGPARWWALVFGIAYLGVAAFEAYLGYVDRTFGYGDTTILEYGMMHNVVHWLTGLLVLGAFFAGEVSARVVARFVGVLFALVTILGIVAPGWTGDLMGHGGELGIAYTVIHALTAVAALLAGFVGTTRTARTYTRDV